ncbi:MAG: response regulator transcription factor [Clostridia bacterium]|nr:response regulator transcription factor [Clostridia bacterium]
MNEEKRAGILVIDDEKMIRESVSAFLKKQGYTCHAASCGTEGLMLFQKGGIDCVLLDLMLPDMPGEEICRRIRALSDVPVIMLTAKNQEVDLLNGFSLGADDYVVKPFSLRELEARISAVLHRWQGRAKAASYLRFGDLTMDEHAHALKKRGVPVDLTQAEWNILQTLMRDTNRVFTRDELIEAAFGTAYDGFDRAIDTHIKNLRKKLEDDPKSPIYIQTVYGLGYRMGGADK